MWQDSVHRALYLLVLVSPSFTVTLIAPNAELI